MLSRLDNQGATPALYAIAAAVFMALAGCGGGKGGDRDIAQRESARAVTLAKVQQMPAEETVFATGRLVAHDRAVLSAKVAGRVQEVAVDLGSRVKKGDLLAQIEKRDFVLQREQAAAALAQARARLGMALDGGEIDLDNVSIVKQARAVFNEAAKNRDRISLLRDQGIIPVAELESVEAAFQVATNRYEEARHEARTRLAVLRERQAEFEIAEQRMIDSSIVAPFDGVVEARQTSPGEFLKDGTPILTVVRLDPIRMRVEAAEKDSPRIQPGQKVRLQVEGDERAYASTIARLSPVISAGNRMLVVEADFENADGRLRPGAFAKAEIVVDETRAGLFVPRQAVTTFAGIQKVFTVSEGKASEVTIRTGPVRGELIEVLTGLKVGQEIVAEPGNLRAGQSVQIAGRAT